MAKKQQAKGVAIEITELNTEKFDIWLKGIEPVIMHDFAWKAWMELVYPGHKDAAARKEELKHDPLVEYQQSMYLTERPGPTRVVLPPRLVKAALCEVTARIPGIARTEVNQLVWIHGAEASLWGVPQLYMTMVRQSGMTRAPDVRTRAIFPEWCCKLTIEVVTPALNKEKVMQLLGYAGRLEGIGDWRPQRGGTYGTFELVEESACRSIIKTGGRKQQEAAIKNPSFHDERSRELFTWFYAELKRRKEGGKQKPKKAKRGGPEAAKEAAGAN